MKKRLILAGICLLVLVLAACGTKDSAAKNQNKEQSGELPYLDVQLRVNPGEVNSNEEVTFTAKVLYGGKPVKKTDEIKFEIWRSQSEHHQKIDPRNNKDGTYTVTKSFSEQGTYYIYAHVTAEGMHSMPKKEFIIGEPSEPETKEDASTNMGKMEHHNNH
ncbi:FixH family protein [Bacillus testis]|uniref:FixH family protein n=1 Tax=Bacillus testis TaxID=1622072 RepID=UPI00067E85C0|nr:FixH family protein [Bacillus testis]